MRAAELAQCIGGSGGGLPDLEQREKVGLGCGEGFVRGVGEFALFFGALAWIGNAEAGGDDEHLGQRFLRACLQQHAAQRGIEWQAGEFAPEWREFVRFAE